VYTRKQWDGATWFYFALWAVLMVLPWLIQWHRGAFS
jgi:hypothetical protein